MNSSFLILPLKEEDAEKILEVYRQCEDFLALGPVPVASLDMVLTDMHHLLAESGNFEGIFVSENSVERLVGVISYITAGYEGCPETASLDLLMIAYPYRSKGIGSEIVKRIEAEIRKNIQVKKILSGVQVNNPTGIRFWQKMGYQIVSEPELMPDQTVVYRLEKSV